MDRIIIDLGHRDKFKELEEFIEKSEIEQVNLIQKKPNKNITKKN